MWLKGQLLSKPKGWFLGMFSSVYVGLAMWWFCRLSSYPSNGIKKFRAAGRGRAAFAEGYLTIQCVCAPVYLLFVLATVCIVSRLLFWGIWRPWLRCPGDTQPVRHSFAPDLCSGISRCRPALRATPGSCHISHFLLSDSQASWSTPGF